MSFPSFIILEGPDAAGKTTLAHVLCHRYNAMVLHGASFGDNDQRADNDDTMRRCHTNLLDIATRNLAMGHPVVCDRLWLSHVVYAQARRDPKVWWADLVAYSEHFKRECALRNALTIFAIDDACVENAMQHQDADHPRTVSEMQKLLQIYKSTYADWDSRGDRCAVYRYTTDGRDIAGYLDQLQAHRGLIG